tara:strand:- start:2117 stop:2311 length:195 start_codon:yes stop_codon:yes gene_type:complete
MAKVKNYYMDEAEKAVDAIIKKLKENVITKSVAMKDILDVEAVNLIDIDEYNVEEVIDMELETA